MGSPKARAGNRQVRRDAKRQDHSGLYAAVVEENSRKTIRAATSTIKPMTDAQRLYDLAIRTNILIFGTGPAGTGKTYFAARRAAEELLEGNIARIIVTRPAIEAGESLGFLPGELDEKFEPYFRPVREALEEGLGSGHLEYLIKAGVIECRPLAYLRGSTFKNCWVIFDESQNSTASQMKMFLTRIGNNCKVIVNGDTSQKDINGNSGLADALRRTAGRDKIQHVQFFKGDIVRSGLCRTIVDCYDDDLEGEMVVREEFGGMRRILEVS